MNIYLSVYNILRWIGDKTQQTNQPNHNTNVVQGNGQGVIEFGGINLAEVVTERYWKLW